MDLALRPATARAAASARTATAPGATRTAAPSGGGRTPKISAAGATLATRAATSVLIGSLAQMELGIAQNGVAERLQGSNVEM